MTRADDLSLRARANAHDLNVTGADAQDRAEQVIRRHTIVPFQKAADGAAATATAETHVWSAPAHALDGVWLKAVKYLPSAALTADNTNNATLTLSKRDTAGGTQVTAAAETTNVASGSWVAFTPKAITLSATVANQKLAAGEQLTLTIAKGGTGVIVPAGTLEIVYDEL